MQTVRKLITCGIAMLMAVPASALADGRRVVDTASLAAAIAEHVNQQDAERAAVHEALARPQVREMASRMGLDVERAAAAVDTLAGADLDRAANVARQVNQQLVGGASNIVISTTTIIIGLLVVILIILIAK